MCFIFKPKKKWKEEKLTWMWSGSNACCWWVVCHRPKHVSLFFVVDMVLPKRSVCDCKKRLFACICRFMWRLKEKKVKTNETENKNVANYFQFWNEFQKKWTIQWIVCEKKNKTNTDSLIFRSTQSLHSKAYLQRVSLLLFH